MTKYLTSSLMLLILSMKLCQISCQQPQQETIVGNPSLSIECRRQQSNCTDNIYPYLNDPQYMFPVTIEHVDNMCKMWSQFVDCIRRYIGNCFEENRRQLFQKSVENSIDTVHAICSSKLYQNEYLLRAKCFREISMEHCQQSYQQLISMITNMAANDEHICCTYAQFKQCVNQPLLNECGRKAKNLMDHSMSFLIQRCQHYLDNQVLNCEDLLSSIDNNQSNHQNNLIDEHGTSSTTPIIVPVHAESREWPSSYASSLSSSSELESNDNNNNNNEPNIQNKRELLRSQMGNVAFETINSGDDDNNNGHDDHHDDDDEIDSNVLSLNYHNNKQYHNDDDDDDTMIVYTIRPPESQIQLLSSSSSLSLSSSLFTLSTNANNIPILTVQTMSMIIAVIIYFYYH